MCITIAQDPAGARGAMERVVAFPGKGIKEGSQEEVPVELILKNGQRKSGRVRQREGHSRWIELL